jgi:hypothetical protein
VLLRRLRLAQRFGESGGYGEAGRWEEFVATVAGWGGRFAELADAHVLAAEGRVALDRGIPLFGFGALRLLGMAQANLGLLTEGVSGFGL